MISDINASYLNSAPQIITKTTLIKRRYGYASPKNAGKTKSSGLMWTARYEISNADPKKALTASSTL
jgi:hypothetical protein